MTQSFGINKQSKLFQKFMNQKNNKLTESKMQQSNQAVMGSQSFVVIQNQSLSINRNDRALTDLTPKVKNFNKCCEMNRKIQQKVINNDVTILPSNSKMLDNSLNYKNELGLDQILRRAIEKVRDGKIQDLFDKKIDHPSLDNKNIQKLSFNLNQHLQAQNSLINQTLSFPQHSNNEQIKKKEQINCRLLKLAQNKQHQLVDDEKLIEAINKIKTLQNQLYYMSRENNKLKIQVNKEINTVQNLTKQNKDLTLQVRELENLVSHKQAQSKQKYDDANYWKNQCQIQQNNFENGKLAMKKVEIDINKLNFQITSIKKERQEKENQIMELKIQLIKLRQENTLAKQYLYQLTIKLFHCQQELTVLRGSNGTKHNYTEIQQKKNSNIIFQHDREPIKINQLNQVPKTIRKRQFSCQHYQKHIITEQSEKTHLKAEFLPKIEKKTEIQNKTLQNNVDSHCFAQTDTFRQHRLANIEQELKQIKQMSFINGKIRRRKIQLERQLEQLKF